MRTSICGEEHDADIQRVLLKGVMAPYEIH